MTDNQFKILIEKLEEIRCGLIDIESVTENTVDETNKALEDIFTFKSVFFNSLSSKMNWNKKEIKIKFNDSLVRTIFKKF